MFTCFKLLHITGLFRRCQRTDKTCANDRENFSDVTTEGIPYSHVCVWCVIGFRHQFFGLPVIYPFPGIVSVLISAPSVESFPTWSPSLVRVMSYQLPPSLHRVHSLSCPYFSCVSDEGIPYSHISLNGESWMIIWRNMYWVCVLDVVLLSVYLWYAQGYGGDQRNIHKVKRDIVSNYAVIVVKRQKANCYWAFASERPN